MWWRVPVGWSWLTPAAASLSSKEGSGIDRLREQVRSWHVSMSGAHKVIYADPPWYWRARSSPAAQAHSRPATSGEGRSALSHYGLMTLADIKALRPQIDDLAAKDCALFLWALNSMTPQALELIEAWGFTFKTVAFTWAKTCAVSQDKWHMGLGYWTRQNTESCLLATRGHPHRLAADVRQLIVSPRREHSRKPDEMYGRIERLVGGPYVELFSRTSWPGWSVAISDQEGMFDAVCADQADQADAA